MTKTVSQLDQEGFFVDLTEAEQSPEDAPGVWLLPYGAVDLDPPVVPYGKRAKLVDGLWQLLDAEVPEETTPQTPEEILLHWRANAVVSRLQARIALHMAGLLEQVEAAITGTEDVLTRLAWQDAQEFRRLSPILLQAAASLELSDEQLDELFVQGAKIVA